MTNIHFAAALFPQHAKSGASALFGAIESHDNAAAEHQRLQRFRTQVTDLLGIPANAEDAFILNELDHLCRRAEECEQDHREARNG